MAFTYDAIADRVKDNVGSFQFINRILNNFSYLKQQSEISVADGGTELKDDIVKPKHFVADGEPERGTIYISDSASEEKGQHTLPWLSEFMRFALDSE